MSDEVQQEYDELVAEGLKRMAGTRSYDELSDEAKRWFGDAALRAEKLLEAGAKSEAA